MMRLAATWLLHASSLACVGAACAVGEVAPQTRPRTVLYVYVVGAARSLATTAANLEGLLCGGADAWADGLPVVPLLHVWANSSCDRDVVVPPFFAAALVNFTMNSLDGAMVKLIARSARTSVERTRAIQFTAQLFHLRNSTGVLLRSSLKQARALGAARTRGVCRAQVAPTLGRRLGQATNFLRACVTLVRDNDVNDVVCILPTPKTKLVPRGCVQRRRSRRGVDFYMSTCCHPDGRGVLSDWVFVTKKRVVDAMDGHKLPPQIYDGGDRAEHRFCRLLVGSNLRLVWPVANSVVEPLFCNSMIADSQAAAVWAGNRSRAHKCAMSTWYIPYNNAGVERVRLIWRNGPPLSYTISVFAQCHLKSSQITKREPWLGAGSCTEGTPGSIMRVWAPGPGASSVVFFLIPAAPDICTPSSRARSAPAPTASRGACDAEGNRECNSGFCRRVRLGSCILSETSF